MCTYLEKVSSTYYFRRPVPKDLVGRFVTKSGAIRTEWKWSLGTKDREEAKRRLPAHVARSNAEIDKARAASVTGMFVPRADPPIAADADAMRRSQAIIDEIDLAAMEGAEYAEAYWDEQDARAESDPTFAAQRELRAAAARLDREREDLRFARDYAKELRQSAAVGVMDLFDRYAAVPGRSPKTIAQWRPYLAKLVEFTGISDASRLTSVNIRDWRNYLRDQAVYRGKRLSAKTINGSYLAAANVVFGWAVDDGLLVENPVLNVKPVKLPATPKGRTRDMTDAEAHIVLSATMLGRQGSEGPDLANAKRWIPWILCYTGARVNEITQLRKEDVREIGGVPCIVIAPEAGSVKNKEARTVPLHSDLVRQGFMAFVASRSQGPLFYNPSKRRSDNAINRQANRLGSKLAAWVRSLGVNPPQPNHSWRHRFVTVAQRYELTERASRAIVGHAPGEQHRRYGDDELPVLSRELEKVPAFVL